MSNNWDWLVGTYWYVPAENLSAPLITLDRADPVWMVDQTVWQITGYRNGYFWGNVAEQIRPALAGVGGGSSATPTAQKLTASVTPEGTIYMAFISGSTSTSAVPMPLGLGRMRLRDGAWAAEMQMATAPNSATQILHWASMLQCAPGDPAWEKLPGTDMSVPEFLAAAGFTVES